MIYQRYDHLIVSHNNLIYCIGGRLKSQLTSKMNSCEVFDPKLNIWNQISNLPEQICQTKGFVYKDQIFCFTGSTNLYILEGNSYNSCC